MTDKEIEVQKALGTYLSAKWKEREKLFAEAYKLYVEANELRTEESLFLKADKLHLEADELEVKADKAYLKVVEEIYGTDVIINWADGSVEIND